MIHNFTNANTFDYMNATILLWLHLKKCIWCDLKTIYFRNYFILAVLTQKLVDLTQRPNSA